jgi:hypothetical protein
MIPGGKKMVKQFEVEWSYNDDDDNEVFVTATGTKSADVPAKMYLKNGDPGYPAEPGEVEIDKIASTDEEGNPVEFDESQYDALEEYIFETVDTDEPDYD